ncbi:hypothetical protein BDV93DRAFT_516236, partial [Ceratobasidium sp. AG-I]
MAHLAPVSSDEDEDDEIKSARYRVFVDPNEDPIPSLPTSRDPTPAETEVETSSAMSTADSNVSNNAKKARRKNTALKRANGVPEVELALCIGRIKESKLPLYDSFEDPFLLYNDDQSVTHYGFKCKACDGITRRQVGVSTTSGLLGHLHRCPSAIKQQHQLAGFGITGGNNSRMTAEQLQKLLHPDARLHRPHRDTISKDVRRIYLATQDDIRKSLAEHSGVFHVALDLFQSGNGYDFLGKVIFRYLAASSPSLGARKITVERFVLECLNYSEAHTGVELAKLLHV